MQTTNSDVCVPASTCPPSIDSPIPSQALPVGCDPAGEQDLALVRSALAGEPTALTALVKRLAPVIRTRVARSLFHANRRAGQQEAADVTQEVFACLFARAGRTLLAWNPSAGLCLEGFVRLVAQRQTASLLRCKSRTPFQHDPLDPATFDEQPVEKARSLESEIYDRQRFVRFVDRLRHRVSPRGAEIFERLFLDMESPQDVAQALDLSLPAVYQWRSRLLKAVREIRTVSASESGTSSTFAPQAAESARGA